ncbi:UNVERIFIED_CONTAM: hypothetical protein Slati_2605500 [Sesamum latifolium]|uniref:Uncharacterized protein n=1 Tax=Sesamum latifolium TaxID=2727402 RepID=A0AAW2VTV3_9LAMI
MITALVRQNLTRLSFKNSSSLCESHHVVFSLSLLRFFTSGERKPVLDSPVYEFLLHKHNFSPEAASRVASVVTRLRNPEKSASVLSFLKESGFSKTQVEKMVKIRPQFLSANLEKSIKPKIKIFQDFGFLANDISEIISNDPWILRQSMKCTLIPSLSVLRSLLGSNAEVAKFLKSSGRFLKTNLGKNLVPNVELLKNCGVAMEQIIRVMYHFPRLLSCKPEVMKTYVDKVDKMGMDRSSRMFIHGVRTIGTMSDKTLELKFRTFRELGFSEGDIAAAFRNAPLVFGASEKKLKEVKEVLLATGKYNLSCIINCPISLKYSIENRYKPRLQVLEMLESKNMIESWPKFSTLCQMSNKRFYEKFIGPYLDEVGDVCMAKSALSGTREFPSLLQNFIVKGDVCPTLLAGSIGFLWHCLIVFGFQSCLKPFAAIELALSGWSTACLNVEIEVDNVGSVSDFVVPWQRLRDFDRETNLVIKRTCPPTLQNGWSPLFYAPYLVSIQMSDSRPLDHSHPPKFLENGQRVG